MKKVVAALLHNGNKKWTLGVVASFTLVVLVFGEWESYQSKVRQQAIIESLKQADRKSLVERAALKDQIDVNRSVIQELRSELAAGTLDRWRASDMQALVKAWCELNPGAVAPVIIVKPDGVEIKKP